jgi:cyclopropane-fatty-acyl-phospholipid synthase
LSEVVYPAKPQRIVGSVGANQRGARPGPAQRDGLTLVSYRRMALTALTPQAQAQTHHAPARIRRQCEAAGIELNGPRPWDMQVQDPALYGDLIRRGSLALGEGYVQGRWNCDQLDGLFTRLLSQDNSQQAVFGLSATAPLRLICEKLELAPGQRLLDLGCGWGGLARFATKHYGASVLGVTVSKQQADACQQLNKGLPVEVHRADYLTALIRERSSFDRVVSVGMMEHVGCHNDRTFFSGIDAVLQKDGLCLLQTIGSTETCDWFDPWINAYIFPNGRLPSAMQLCRGW